MARTGCCAFAGVKNKDGTARCTDIPAPLSHTRKVWGLFVFSITDASETRADESDDGIKDGRMREMHL